MSRIPDYDKMRHKLASYYADNFGEQDVYDMVMHGFQGFEHESNEEILETFVNLFDAKDIPKKPLTEDEMNQMALKNEDQRIERGDDNPISIHMFRDQMKEDD